MTTDVLEKLYAELNDLSSDNNISLDPETSLQTADLQDEDITQLSKEALNERFLKPSNRLPWSLLNEFEIAPELSESKSDNLNFSLMNKPDLLNRTSIRFKRSGIDGSIVGYSEEFAAELLEEDNGLSSSLSFNREYTGYSKLNIKGTTASLPFLPGGLNKSEEANQSTPVKNAIKFLHRDQYGLFDIPQGFTRGLRQEFQNVDLDIINGKTDPALEIDLLADELDENNIGDEDADADADIAIGIDDGDLNFNEESESQNRSNNMNSVVDDSFEKEIANFIPKTSIMRSSAANSTLLQQQKRKTNWAHVVDLNHKIENFDELIPNPARTWPFELDIFQQEAVYHLEQGDSVFVAAHTSAGKTVVAEYAIAMAHKNMTKAIYTSPIKALSNQKFRDFRSTFKDIDVGVITGDVQINPDANCLIMTTEILRSMLYRGSDVIRDVEFVIFDEVHYVNDVDRGVVWEEVIIMLPDHVKIILLSATVPNTLEFASWVGRTKQKDIYVISTLKRPVPLEIFLFAKDSPFKVIDSNRNFLETGFNQHSDKFLKTKAKDNDQALSSRGGKSGFRGGRGGGRGGGSNSGNTGPRFIKRDAPTSKSWITLVDYLRKQDLLPAVIFVFSKRRCEEYAETLSGFNFSTARESSEIHMFIDKAVSRLKKEDRELPQILRMREMLKRGIAVHHGGLLPIIKEVVEILFSRSLIKVLFATETFAMGLNLPTRTVVFSSLRKHDGTGFRDLLPGEFTQMSGRAGRRGLDKIGTVMIMAYQQAVDKNSLKQVALGTPTKLSSQFRLTYTMILNLLRIEALKVEDMIKRSFGENSSQSMLPDQQLEIVKLEKDLQDFEKLDITAENLIKLERIYLICEELKKSRIEVGSSLLKIKSRKMRKPGRLIVFKNKKGESMVGITINSGLHAIDCLVACEITDKEQSSKTSQTNLFFNPSFSEKFNDEWFPRWNTKVSIKMHVESVPLHDVEYVSHEFVKVSKEIFNKKENNVREFIEELSILLSKREFWKELDIHYLMNESNVAVISKHIALMQELSTYLNDSQIILVMEENDNYLKVSSRMQIVHRVDELKQSLNDENLELLPEYNKRLEVLKKLNYIDPEQLTINLKGRVACEINSGFELIITELVFENFLGSFSSEEIVALLSCFVFEGKRGNKEDQGETKLSTPRLERGKEKICSIVERVMTLSTELQIQLTAEEDAFLENDRFALVNTVYEWARGRTFKEIMEYANDADESEGTIVRVITFLDEICNQVKNAALITGDSALHSKMTDAQEKIKRDIVFCASLYL
jgi:antiviral helicase SKI2